MTASYAAIVQHGKGDGIGDASGGGSVIVAPNGEVLAGPRHGAEGILTANTDPSPPFSVVGSPTSPRPSEPSP